MADADEPPITDDGFPCTQDICLGGIESHPAGNAGTECRASAGVCDIAESCDGSSVTCPVDGFASSAADCTDDGEPCTDDKCDGAGTCAHRPDDTNTCSDDTACTSDTCQDGSCVSTANHAACDDGLFCNGVESCDETDGCQAGTEPTLDDAVACTTDACDEGADRVTHTPLDTACSDTNVCNGCL